VAAPPIRTETERQLMQDETGHQKSHKNADATTMAQQGWP
jgi:hypothetical protein